MDQWRSLANGERTIAVGARSAIFAPVKNLGLIIVDEEHDQSYKQDERFSYNGRDLAILRAKKNSATVLLGSATPAIESFFQAQQNDEIVSMPSRVHGMHTPKVQVVDMRKEPKEFGRPAMLSSTLKNALQRTLSEKKSAIIFLNRRGYTPTMICAHCGAIPKCHQCAVSLTYHKGAQAGESQGNVFCLPLLRIRKNRTWSLLRMFGKNIH